jgi:hypothetical protein
MDLFSKQAANILFSDGKPPKGFVDGDGIPQVGYGKFLFLEHSFQYPLEALLVKGKLACNKWSFDNTNVIYSLTCNGKSRSRYHGTLEQLFHSSEPYIFKLDMKKVRECLDSGNDFIYIDNSYDHYEVSISKKYTEH